MSTHVHIFVNNRFIYWVTGASIQQSYLDGSEVATLKVFKASECANAIAVENRQLFWIDQCDTGHIHVLNLDSPFENTILGQARTRPHYGLTVFNGVLYWTTAGGSIVSNDIITEQQVVGDLGSSHWSGVRTIHSQRQPRAVNSTGTSQSALSSDFLTETSLSIHLTTSLKEADFDTSLIVETDTQIMFEMIPFSTELYTHIESTSSAFYYTATETGLVH